MKDTKEGLLNNVPTVFVHVMKVNGAQNNTRPCWLSLYEQNISSFVFHRRKNSQQLEQPLQVSKYFYFSGFLSKPAYACTCSAPKALFWWQIHRSRCVCYMRRLAFQSVFMLPLMYVCGRTDWGTCNPTGVRDLNPRYNHKPDTARPGPDWQAGWT